MLASSYLLLDMANFDTPLLLLLEPRRLENVVHMGNCSGYKAIQKIIFRSIKNR